MKIKPFHLLISFLLLLTLLNLIQITKPKKRITISTEDSSLEAEKHYWLRLSSENPTYLDAWLRLAEIDYELGNVDFSKGWLNQAKKINPNSKEVKTLEEKLFL